MLFLDSACFSEKRIWCRLIWLYLPDRRQRHSPFHQSPGPDQVYNEDVDKAEHKTASEHNRMILPSIIGCDSDFGHSDSPWQDPTNVAD